jgi:hypothetical protein
MTLLAVAAASTALILSAATLLGAAFLTKQKFAPDLLNAGVREISAQSTTSKRVAETGGGGGNLVPLW